jgi:hygromycin-B 7''-O-kinase
MAAKYSERLGEISEEQFQKALNIFNLGSLISTTPITQGLLGQNVFVTTDKGEYVFRGKPHHDWQFETERNFITLLHEKTKVPVPFPYLISTDKNIFGWEFVFMPKMKGLHLSDCLDETFLSEKDRFEIAVAQGIVLNQIQAVTHSFCGKYDPSTNTVIPYQLDYFTEFSKQIINNLTKSIQYNTNTTQQDIVWTKNIIDQASKYFRPFIPTLCLRDFKPGNMVVKNSAKKWKISGIFDFSGASFGHPESDISRLFIVYQENNQINLGYQFISSYLTNKTDVNNFIKRFPFFVLLDRLIIWDWAQRTNKAWWPTNWSFERYAGQFISPPPALYRLADQLK